MDAYRIVKTIASLIPQPRLRGLPASSVAGAVRARGGRRGAATPFRDGGDGGETAAADHPDDDAGAADHADGRHDDDQDADARQRHGEDRGEPAGLQKTSGTSPFPIMFWTLLKNTTSK